MSVRSIKRAPRVITKWLGYSEVSACCFVMKGRVVYARKSCVVRENQNHQYRPQPTNWGKRFASKRCPA